MTRPPDAAHRPDGAALGSGAAPSAAGAGGAAGDAADRAHQAYGALARPGSDDAAREHARRRRRRWVQAGAAAVALSFVVLLAASVERGPDSAVRRWRGPAVVLEEAGGGAAGAPAGGGEGDGGEEGGGAAGAVGAAGAAGAEGEGGAQGPDEKKPKVDAYCAVFMDPTECDKQRVEGKAKYWTDAEVRAELWKTMKALAELELREDSMHKAHKAKAKEQASLFDLFRQTMGQEVEDIHRLQDEMHQRHTAAFKQLVQQVLARRPSPLGAHACMCIDKR
jgi:hypothetical protein